jgi:branched-chain amino acid transport system permease protein
VRRAASRALTIVLGTLLCIGVLGALGVGTAHAEGETVKGTLRNEGEAVAGVTIAAEGPGGFSEEIESGADGTWEIPVPAPGAYTVSIDEDSLPDGVALRNPDRTSLETTVAVGQQKTVLFALGEGTRRTTGMAGQALQLTVEGIRFGLILALGAVGLSLIFGTTGLTNFAHGELITLGALVAYLFNVPFNIPLIPAAVLTLLVCGVAAGLQDLVLWRRLRRRGTGLIAMMIVSIGLSLLARYIYLYIFGGANRSYGDYAGQAGLSFGPVSLTPKDIVAMVVATVVLILVSIALLKTRIGKATRAVSDNPALASASGIDVERVIQVVWVAGGVLAGLSGILLALSQQVSFQLGFQVLLLVFAAVTLGGLGTAFGALAGSMVVGLFINVSTLIIPSELKNVGALGILIVILLVRPQGLLGRAERVG